MLTAALRSSASRVRGPSFDVVHEWPYPDDPLLCVVWRAGDRVSAIVNMAHGLEGYDHAAYHAAHGVDGLAQTCRLGEPCGYAGDPRLAGAPPCAPSRGCHLRPV